jgi:hypothetical protein
MGAALAPFLASRKVSVELIDVDADPTLEARWGDKVPVLLSGEEELCHYRLDAVAVSRWLERATDDVSR